MKIKRLVFALLVSVGASAYGAIGAGADTGGHFTSDVSSTNITGIEGGTHKISIAKQGDANTIQCVHAHYKGHIAGTTVENILLTPAYSTCKTTGSETHFEIHENGCKFRFTIGNAGSHHTGHLECPAGSKLRITHPNCTMEVPPQTVTGVVYKTTVENGKHAITLEATVQNTETQFESGICVFLGTTHQFEISGSVTVLGFDTLGNQVNITATTN